MSYINFHRVCVTHFRKVRSNARFFINQLDYSNFENVQFQDLSFLGKNVQFPFFKGFIARLSLRMLYYNNFQIFLFACSHCILLRGKGGGAIARFQPLCPRVVLQGFTTFNYSLLYIYAGTQDFSCDFYVFLRQLLNFF